MSLVAYTITALQRDVADAAGTGKQVIIGATCSMFLQPADTAVVLYDNAAGANGNTAKLTGSNGQVVVYVQPGQYRLSVNGINSYVTVAAGYELGTAATADLTTSATDATPGRVYKVGDQVGIEYGSNANGQYTKLPDGTLISSLSINFETAAAKVITYPYEHIASAPIHSQITTGNVLASRNLIVYLSNSVGATFALVSGGSYVTGAAQVTAIGRWK